MTRWRKKKPSDIIREQGKEAPEFGKNSDVKAKIKKQGTVKDIEENEKQAKLKGIWNAIHEIKSLLSKHTADTSQTLENMPNPSNKERVIILKKGVAMTTSAIL